MKSYCSLSGNVLLHTSVKLLCLGVESPSFHGSAGEFTGLHRPPRSQLWFLMVKDTQPSPRKEKTPGKVQGKLGMSYNSRLPGEPHRMNFIPETFMTATPVKRCPPG